jgi:hypothetical protein
MKNSLASLPMAGFIAARNNQEKNLKKTPDADEHMQMASDHQFAARSSISAKDHNSAADHLKKAAFHNEKAAQYYKKHSACYIDRAMKGK